MAWLVLFIMRTDCITFSQMRDNNSMMGIDGRRALLVDAMCLSSVYR